MDLFFLVEMSSQLLENLLNSITAAGCRKNRYNCLNITVFFTIILVLWCEKPV